MQQSSVAKSKKKIVEKFTIQSGSYFVNIISPLHQFIITIVKRKAICRDVQHVAIKNR